jgi:hypothetical protein
MRWLAPALVAALGAAAAAETRPRVAVLELAIEGDAEPELRPQLLLRLEGAVRGAGFDVVGRDEVAAKLRTSRALVGCTSTACLARVGALVNAKRFIKARVEASGAAFTIELELLGADAPGGQIRRLERACPVCTLSEVNDRVGRAVVELITGRQPELRAVKLVVDTRPAGASVSCDDSLLGIAPVEVELEPGEHLCRATLPVGYLPAERREVVAPDSPARIVLTLEAEASRAPVAVAEAQPTRRYGTWKWVAAGGAGAAVVGGVTLLAIDGHGVDCAPGATCRSVYSTRDAGIALVAAGAALGALAAWLFLSDR